MTHIIEPKRSWEEKLQRFSPQVKAALIGGGSTLLLAAFGYILQYSAYTKENSRLKQEVRNGGMLSQSNDILAQLQTATIQSYQAENAKLTRQIAGIEAERDPSESAVKKRTANLAGQLFDFITQWQKGEPGKDRLNDTWRTNGDFSKAFMEHADNSMLHDRAMGVEFARKFVGRLSSLRDQLAGLGIQSDILDSIIIDEVRTRFDVQRAAEELQKLALSSKH